MIKRIIFDIDNTLIRWKDEYWNSVTDTLKELQIPYNDDVINDTKKAINMYECKCDTYTKEQINQIISEYTGLDIPKEFTDIWIKYLKKCAPTEAPVELIRLLEYLNSKYEVVVLSNWFLESQTGRLEQMGILKYFKNIYCTEDFKIKPFKEPYIKACGEHLPSECLMIGDNLEIDIKGALNAGLQAILYDYENKYDYEPKATSYQELLDKLSI